MNVLNVAAGYLPLHRTDIGATRLVNFDPLSYSPQTARLIKYLDTIDVDYFSRAASVDSVFGDDSVDLVMSISPYGFALVNQWSHDKLRSGGYVLAFGNERNNWLKVEKMFEGTLEEQFEVIEYTAADAVIKAIAERVKGQYDDAVTSHTTGLGRETPVNKIVCARKRQ
jgi:hypothetical protein